MPTHDFTCNGCRVTIQDTTAKGIHYCPACKKPMRWDFGNRKSGGDYYHVSESLGITPEQTAEHKKHWPNVDVLPGGKLGFRSVKEQQRYANHFGLDKAPGKLKKV